VRFILAVEFYRRVYHRNPGKSFDIVTDRRETSECVSETLWPETVNNVVRRPIAGVYQMSLSCVVDR